MFSTEIRRQQCHLQSSRGENASLLEEVCLPGVKGDRFKWQPPTLLGLITLLAPKGKL